ncbi:Protein CBG25386 [Caenorhabditis briggsae]|uniref:Protein CBG25386 n=1 Tax=Caenorhabditis briggsae TaxID=6238 RepID=B6IIQ0_CAEBR|nr:Protein CBG25386 [Caenorhabditis briggsae]CAR99780.1 Protein CBG25386 [Caenorhabditis briggsae]
MTFLRQNLFLKARDFQFPIVSFLFLKFFCQKSMTETTLSIFLPMFYQLIHATVLLLSSHVSSLRFSSQSEICLLIYLIRPSSIFIGLLFCFFFLLNTLLCFSVPSPIGHFLFPSLLISWTKRQLSSRRECRNRDSC